MKNDEDKDRDNWARMTLRLPAKLHSELLEQTGVLSLNALIIQKLEFAMRAEGEIQRLKNSLDMAGADRAGMELEVMSLKKQVKERRLREPFSSMEDLVGYIQDVVDRTVTEKLATALHGKLSDNKKSKL